MNNISIDESALKKRTTTYVKNILSREPSGHDWFHIERVGQIAKVLQAKEGGDIFLIEMAVLLHNVKEHYCFGNCGDLADMTLEGIMDVLQIEGDLRTKINKLVDESKYRANETKTPDTIEGKIIQDANWLDALGAIGVARAFASGGFFQRPIFDPKVNIRHDIPKDVYSDKRRTTSFNYLFEKSLSLVKKMNTATGKKIAEQRIKFVKQFIEQFLLESTGKDIGEIQDI